METGRKGFKNMGKETRENSKAWSKVYETTDFGNKYPTDGLVSLYYHFIVTIQNHPYSKMKSG